MTGNTFTNVLTFCKTANGLIWSFIEHGARQALDNSTTAIRFEPKR